MKKLIVLLVVGVIAVGAMQAWAGCCSSKKKDAAASCTDNMASLNLTDEQKAKISELETACKAAGDDKEACAKYKEQIRGVLTDEQRTAWDEACKSHGHAGCGEKKTES